MRVQLEGEDEPVEVEPEQVDIEDDDPFLSQDEVDGVVQKRLNRERRKLLRNVGLDPSEFRDGDGTVDLSGLDEDAAFRQLAEARGIELREDGQPKGSVSDEEIQELRQKASKVDSLQEQLSEYEQQIHSTRETKLENELLSNADGVKEDMQDVFMSYAKSRFTYDDDYGWVATNDEGEVEFEGGEPVRPGDFVERTRENRPSMFQDSSMSDGPSSSPSDEGGSPDTMTREEFESMSPAKQKGFVDEGGQVVDE